MAVGQYQVGDRVSGECERGRPGKEDDYVKSGQHKRLRKSSPSVTTKQLQLVTILIILAREIILQTQSNSPQGGSSTGLGRHSYRSPCRPLVTLVAAENEEQYAEASADSPSVDSLDDDDDENDNEELDSSASNEYPDGDNDNDESYDDAEDDRQESRTHNRWLHRGDPEVTRNDRIE